MDGDSELLNSTGVLFQSTVGNTKYILSPLGEKLLKFGLKYDVHIKEIGKVQVDVDWNDGPFKSSSMEKVMARVQKEMEDEQAERAQADLDFARGK